ncbi:DNA-nicking Smr family endonuclease [Sphaerotilus hippei]|uniref:DNA-nicking Smr family endonuclease n=1 Tax=Sphaerotilus hippei TaxID=744406 RepID=A0A318H527_9BURK|nr:Smr/MutS family protein [Sphaerotilus hippei]PXW96500.1 DNA-nicking Smr family endonuclease [Sphaerotilus hippei]
MSADSASSSRVRPASPVLRLSGLSELRQVRRELQERARRHEEELARRAAEEAARRREHELFARLVGPVTPLREHDRAQIARPRPDPVPRQRELDDLEVMRSSLSDEFDAASLMETDDQMSYRREGVGQEVLRKLRTGTWAVQGHIDLHGMTREVAREALVQFLGHAGKRGWRCVRVVHGKGLGSPGRQPVLKGKVRGWLVQRQEVLAFAHALGHDGGAGALIVLLDSSTPRHGG